MSSNNIHQAISCLRVDLIEAQSQCGDYMAGYRDGLTKAINAMIEAVKADKAAKGDPQCASTQVDTSYAESQGWYREPKAGPDVWHKVGVSFCLKAELPQRPTLRTLEEIEMPAQAWMLVDAWDPKHGPTEKQVELFRENYPEHAAQIGI